MNNRDDLDASTGFAPIASADALVLILGSLPGRASLDAAEYYAHPRNAFWRIMQAMLGVCGDYEARCRQLVARRIAVWDVLGSSVRPGSLDTSIRMATAMPNDFASFLGAHPDLRRICFNGRKAESMFRRLVLETLDAPVPDLVVLPSTSPAFASMPFDAKLVHWRRAIVNECLGESQ